MEKIKASQDRRGWDSGNVPQKAVGDINAYLRIANEAPLLTEEEESIYCKNMRKNVAMRHKVATSHLRLAASIARQFEGYGFPHDELIQEANIGLMKAIDRFDPENGAKFSTYAQQWIRAEISEYVVRNWRIVRLGTTKAQRKIFFNLRSMREKFRQDNKIDNREGKHLSMSEVTHIANALDVHEHEVIEMAARMIPPTMSIDTGSSNMDADHEYDHHELFGDDYYEPSKALERIERTHMQSSGIKRGLEALDPRSRDIIESRWLDINDDSTSMSLHQLASKYGVSAERIRQIESKALRKMREEMTTTH